MGRMSETQHPDPGGPVASGRDPSSPAPGAVVAWDIHVNRLYGLCALVLLALGFGAWGAWMVFGGRAGEDPEVLRQQLEALQQRATTLARSDQISREANRELQSALAEREELVAGLRAEVAFYERFVGSTAPRGGLAVHELQIRPGQGRVWHFTTTLTQSMDRGRTNQGGLTMAIEGTRRGRLEQLGWSDLRQHDGAPPVEYSFKYFQQVEGDIVLPDGFTPARVTVRATPEGGPAVEQSFPWADATGRSSPGA